MSTSLRQSSLSLELLTREKQEKGNLELGSQFFEQIDFKIPLILEACIFSRFDNFTFGVEYGR